MDPLEEIELDGPERFNTLAPSCPVKRESNYDLHCCATLMYSPEDTLIWLG